MKKNLIFGATGSIGYALVKKLYDNGDNCHLVGRQSDLLKEMSEEFNYNYSVCDVLNLDHLEELSKELSETDVSGIAYCIGSIDLKPFRQTEAKDFISSFALNLVSVTDILKMFETSLKKNNGSVVLFSTIAARKGFSNHSIISASKSALEGLSVALAAEFAPSIRVNCIAPSLTDSKISNFLIKNEKNKEMISKLHPLKRIGQGSDSASLAKFLLSEESSWITGQIIGVDGGRSTLT